jgi:Ca2+/Na+ antiporter
MTMVGVQVGIPMSLLGLAFLTIGSSMGDFANNLAMVKRGIPDLSMAAVFAVHIMNLEISIGLGIILYLSSNNSTSAVVHKGLFPGACCMESRFVSPWVMPLCDSLEPSFAMH